MEQTIKGLFELDRLSRERMAQTEQERDAIESSADEKIKEIRRQYMDRAEQRIERLSASQKAMADERIEHLNVDLERQVKLLGDIYAREEETWLSKIVGSVTEV